MRLDHGDRVGQEREKGLEKGREGPRIGKSGGVHGIKELRDPHM